MSRRSWSRCWLMATALISISAFCDGHGSPRWENVNDQFGKIQSYEKLTPFLVNIDEGRMCRADVDQIIFFTGNDCKGKLAGSTIATPGNCFRNIRWMTRRDSCWEPEAARSMLIRKNFPVLGTIHVCDHATGCFEDGFAKITVKQQPTTVLPKLIKDLVFEGAQMPQAPIAYCVNTFEHSYEDIWVKVEFDSGVMQRGLDGAVSRIGVCYFGNEGNPQTDENTMPYDHLQDAEDSSQDI